MATPIELYEDVRRHLADARREWEAAQVALREAQRVELGTRQRHGALLEASNVLGDLPEVREHIDAATAEPVPEPTQTKVKRGKK